jgi:hypothetical protein
MTFLRLEGGTAAHWEGHLVHFKRRLRGALPFSEFLEGHGKDLGFCTLLAAAAGT